MPEREKDAILFGSAGDPHPDHITLWGLRLKICQGFDQYANVRPTRILPASMALQALQAGRSQLGDRARKLEGEYSGVGGRVHQGHPIEAATDVSIMTRAALSASCASPFPRAFAAAQAAHRGDKSNAQRHAMVMWDEIAAQVAGEVPDVKWDKELVDAATAAW